MKAILGRRSIRKFTGAQIPDEDVKKLLEAAMSAPSACNQQPWHFVVVRDKKTHEKIMEIQPYTKMLEKASLAVVVCADPDLQTCPGYWVQDVSAATENILLAVHALGYGATWCGIYPRDDPVWKLRELIGLPKNVVPLNVIAIGVPDEEKPPANRYNEDRVHHEKW
ncbi:nitroreductase family protein [Candidatus Bathyarchaeota archaeon]|jgi:nitroreductase|nr:nitroreductase family protein [Candidatus Bathyarchaeota archaeon]TFH14975.1 MAG: nitroreductase family protein [Candidatus Bathyarchaeota archaeon]